MKDTFPESAGALLPVQVIRICLVFLLAVQPLIMNPFAFDYYCTPKITAVYALILIIAAAAAARLALHRRLTLPGAAPLTLPLVCYGASAVISTVFSVAPRLSIRGDRWREEGVFALLSYVALTFIFAGFVESRRQFRGLVQALLVSSTLVALYGIVQYLGFNPTEHFVPLFRTASIQSTIGNANFLGKFLVLVLPLHIAWYLVASSRRGMVLRGAGIMICFCALVLTFTRASWVGFLAALAVFAWAAGSSLLRGKAGRIAALLLITLSFSLLIGCYSLVRTAPGRELFFTHARDRIVSSFDLRTGIGSATRLFIWEKTIGVIRKRPWIGYGPDANVVAMRSFNLEFNEKFSQWAILDRAHNNYLDIIVGQGLLGLTAYLGVVITFLIWLRKTKTREQNESTKLFYCGMFAATCGYLVNDFFIFSTVSVSPAFWSLMGITLACRKLQTPEAAGRENRPPGTGKSTA